MKKLRNLLTSLLFGIICVCLALGFTSCDLYTIKGDKGDRGETGVGIQSIEKIDTASPTDTYEILYTNGSTTTFTVTNGANGKDGVSITNATVNQAGELVLTFSEGDPINLGKIVGENGKDGVNGTDGVNGKDGVSITNATLSEEGVLILTLSNATSITVGNVKGQNGIDGKDGASVSKTEINENGELVITLSNGISTNLGKVVGENGKDGTDGANGKDGVGIENVTLTNKGELTVILTSGTVIDLGNIKGHDGADGENGKDGVSVSKMEINETGELVITLSNGNSTNLGKVVGDNGKDGVNGENGADGIDGKDGVGVATVTLNDAYELTITLTNGTEIPLGNIRGEKGETGDKGDSGKSAYELYKERYGYTGTEEQWLFDLVNGKLSTKQMHTVTFDTNGGSVAPEAQTVEHLTKLTRPEEPTLENYVFDGWYVDGEKWSFVGYVVSEDMTLTAKWVPAEYEIRYHLNGGDEIDQPFNSFTVEDLPLALNLPSTLKDYAVFDGWYLDEAYTIPATEITQAGHADVYVKWLNATEGLRYTYSSSGVSCIVTRYTGTATEIIIPERVLGLPVRIIDESAFKNKSIITSIHIPDCIRSIGASAFDGCTGLTEINLPNYLKVINSRVFAGCTSLETIILPDGVASIGSSAFSGCTSLENIILPDGVASIGANAFSECTSLEDIILPDSVTSIGANAFANSGLRSIIIPKSVTTMGSDVFYGRSSLPIYCEVASAPSGWNENWNRVHYVGVGNVVYEQTNISPTWGYTGN